MSASAHYQRATGERSDRPVGDERLLAEIRCAHKANYACYRSRQVYKQLVREGNRVARCTVERLIAEHRIQKAKRRGRPWRTTKPDPDAGSGVDLVERDFTAQAPNRLWVGPLFFAFVLGVFSPERPRSAPPG